MPSAPLRSPPRVSTLPLLRDLLSHRLLRGLPLRLLCGLPCRLLRFPPSSLLGRLPRLLLRLALLLQLDLLELALELCTIPSASGDPGVERNPLTLRLTFFVGGRHRCSEERGCWSPTLYTRRPEPRTPHRNPETPSHSVSVGGAQNSLGRRGSTRAVLRSTSPHYLGLEGLGLRGRYCHGAHFRS